MQLISDHSRKDRTSVSDSSKPTFASIGKLTVMLCFLRSKKLISQLIIYGLMLTWFNLLQRILCDTQSKALLICGFIYSVIIFLCERFEPRSYFIIKLSMIVRVNVVLNRTVD